MDSITAFWQLKDQRAMLGSIHEEEIRRQDEGLQLMSNQLSRLQQISYSVADELDEQAR